MLQTLLSHLKNFWERFTGVEKKLLLFLIVLLAASYFFSVRQNRTNTIAAPKIGGAYTEGLVGQPMHINPLLAPSNEVDADLSRIVYTGLLKFDSNLNLVPDLAESMPQISPDGKEYTIKLKDKIYWHDGALVTADDVAFTFQIIQNPDFGSPLRFSWNRVGVEKIDDRTVKLTTRESSATFFSNLTTGILPKHVWENVPADSFALSKFNLEPIGTGPFRITEIKRGRDGEIKSVQMVAYKRYYGGEPYLRNLTFRFYETPEQLIEGYQGRDIQGLGYVPFDRSLFIEAKANLRQIHLSLPQYQAVFINRAKNPAALDDVKVRLAIAKSVDKEKIISEVYGGQASPAYGPILPGHLGYHEQIPGADMNIYDPEKAKQLLEEAGWIVDPTIGFRKDKQDRIITLGLATNNFSPNVRVAEELKKMWEGIGIQIILNIETVADLEEKFIRPRQFELLLFSENVGADPDPYPFWHSFQLRDPGLNLSNFSNKAADKLLVDARTNLPADQRAAKYKQFQELFVGDVPAIFLNRSVFVYNLPSQVKGVELENVVIPADRFADINKWYIETKRVKK